MDHFLKLMEKKCLVEQSINTQVTNALNKLVFDVPEGRGIINSPQFIEAASAASTRLDLIEHSIKSVLTLSVPAPSSQSSARPSKPSAIQVPIEPNRPIKEEPVDENVTFAIPNQEKEIATATSSVVKETVDKILVKKVVPIEPLATRLSSEQKDQAMVEPVEEIENFDGISKGNVMSEQALNTGKIMTRSRSVRLSQKHRLSPEPKPQSKMARLSASAQSTPPNRRSTTKQTQDNPLICPACAKPFTRSGDFTKHLRTHTGLKPYRCIWPECSFSAGDRSNVARHVRVMHLNLPATKKEQRARGIVEQRDERDYLINITNMNQTI